MSIYTKSSWDEEVEVNVEAYGTECQKHVDKALEKLPEYQVEDFLELSKTIINEADTHSIDVLVDFYTGIYDARLTTSRKKTDE